MLKRLTLAHAFSEKKQQSVLTRMLRKHKQEKEQTNDYTLYGAPLTFVHGYSS